jgi:hypothetical protein
VCLHEEQKDMISDIAIRALSIDELDAVSGGKDDLVVCRVTRSFSFLGYMDINFATCENGDQLVTATFD